MVCSGRFGIAAGWVVEDVSPVGDDRKAGRLVRVGAAAAAPLAGERLAGFAALVAGRCSGARVVGSSRRGLARAAGAYVAARDLEQ